jgi:hypothetical protein
MFDTADDKYIADRIDELTELPTFPSFCHGFYRLIADYVRDCGTLGERLRRLFAHFLTLELWYHRELERMVGRDRLTVGDLQSLSDKRRVNLLALTEVASASLRSHSEERIRHLILAECHYHTRHTEKVVAHLEWAVQAGADDPIVYFSLGYNRFALALESYVRRGESPDEWLIKDYAHFQSACLEAVKAFEKALAGGQEDRPLYDWIARILHIAGFHDDAERAEGQARACGGGEDDDYSEDESWDEEIADDGALSGPVSLEEVEDAGVLLRGSFTVEELLGDADAL